MGNSIVRVCVNGVDLEVQDEGSGPGILFIHGFPLDRRIWRHQVEHLDGWRRIAPDLRGMGRSQAPAGGYSMESYATDLALLLDALGVERAVLSGLSMGGYIAFDFLRRFPERVAGLVLMDTRAEADSDEGRRNRDAMIAAVRERGAVAVVEAMLPKLLAPATASRCPELVSEVRAMMEATPVQGIVGALEAMRDRPDSTALLSGLQGLPALVVVGEADAITPPEVARVMAERLPQADLVVVPEAGHLSPLEQPAWVTARLREFLAGAVQLSGGVERL
jgi:pimeloyl-ACP methyl ester carboxylesterase